MLINEMASPILNCLVIHAVYLKLTFENLSCLNHGWYSNGSSVVHDDLVQMIFNKGAL